MQSLSNLSGSVPSDKMSLRTTDPLYAYNYIATWRLQWDYFGSTLKQIALWEIQFERAALLLKILYNIFWHNTDYIQMWFCLVFCFAACNHFGWLAEGWHKFYRQSWVQEQILCEHTWPHYVVKYAHTKLVLVLKTVGKYSVHNMLQTRTPTAD